MHRIFAIVIATTFLRASPVFASRHNTTVVAQILTNAENAARLLVAVTFVLAVALFGWGMAKFIFAAGDPQKIAEAKNTIWWGVIGIFVIATIGGIIYWIGIYLGVNTTTNPPLNPPAF
jgi:hypothetical protein